MEKLKAEEEKQMNQIRKPDRRKKSEKQRQKRGHVEP
jgi:hypothetical protein